MTSTPATITQREDVVLVDQLYTTEQAASFFGFKTKDWVEDRIKDGTLPYVDLNPYGSRPNRRVAASAINALINQLTLKEAAC